MSLRGVGIAFIDSPRLLAAIVGLLLVAGVASAIGISSSGGGFTTFIKADFIAGNTSDTRVGGGQQPAASFGDNTTVYCGRLGVLDSVKCLLSPAPPVNVTEGTCGSYDDFRIVSNKVGLRRLNWLKRGVALNAGLPDGD